MPLTVIKRMILEGLHRIIILKLGELKSKSKVIKLFVFKEVTKVKKKVLRI